MGTLGTIIVLLVVGLIVGALARAVLPGRQALPLWLTALIGAGSLLLAGLVIPGHRTLIEVIVGVVIAAAIIALTQGGVRSKSTSRI
ncbi:MAG: GlsB/YeaQ/YmgE family stress response membrane protein [Actinobacteria bacterium]|nr:GlsB/YeaQ/YmgE family stress response membrane protein [Actinomycetota bacterium]